MRSVFMPRCGSGQTVGVGDIGCEVHCRAVASGARLGVVSEIVAGRDRPSILGGNESRCEDNRFSTWACEPTDVFQFDSSQTGPFEKLGKVLGRIRLESVPGSDELPAGMFSCGWIGYFSYDLGRSIEAMPQRADDDLEMPLIRLCFYDRAICYDHAQQQWRLVVLRMADDRESVDDKFHSLEEILRQAERTDAPEPAAGDLQAVDVSKLACNMTKQYYFETLEKIGQHIYDGDVYQINFSQRFECDYSARPVDLYHWQNRYNASPYAAFVDAGDFAIVSASPEMFVTVTDGVISTKPIKGTRRRYCGRADADELNRLNFAELVQSEKDQAELNMIVDLERNDIARICKPGTRKVTQRRTIEEYPTVFHAVATVGGELAEPDSLAGFCDIMRAMFPGGSITGAPKIRAMEIIDTLEPTQRGVYTGSIGYIGVDGGIGLNIAIRTVVIRDGRAYAQVGGGIVADSDSTAEWDETITKARALIAGIQAVHDHFD